MRRIPDLARFALLLLLLKLLFRSLTSFLSTAVNFRVLVLLSLSSKSLAAAASFKLCFSSSISLLQKEE